MRLHRHDELVEAMAKSLIESFVKDKAAKSMAAAALDAMLEAAVRMGVATPERFRVSDEIDERTLVLRMEASDE